MKPMTMEEAIGKVPGMSLGHYRDAKILEEKCPKCGSEVVCVYDDLGMVDYYDNFAHICLNADCDYLVHQESFTSNIGGRSDIASNSCVHCGRDIHMTW